METCDWVDPACWSLEPAPVTPVAPQNDGTNFFAVWIDGGSALPSSVDLDAAATVDRVEVGSGDTLRLLDGSRLTLQYDATRPGSGQLRNDGTLALQSTGAGARLEFIAPYDSLGIPTVEISGAGTIELSDHVANFVGAPFQSQPVRVALGQEQTLRGAGEIRIVFNRGTIEATGINPLVVKDLTNEGVLRAIGSGGVELAASGYFTNTGSGLIEIDTGSRLVSESTLDNFGILRVRGEASFANTFLDNAGLIEVLDGATLSADGVHQVFSGSLIRVGAGSTFEGGGRIEGGTLRIEDGLLRAPSGLRIGDQLISSSRARLEGIGRVLGNLEFVDGTLATGLGGVGRLDVDGGVSFLDDGVWEVDLAGTDAGLQDRLAVSGTASFAAESAFGSGSRIDLALLPGYAPAAGDRIDILSAASISAPAAPLTSLFTAPDLDGDLYLAPEIAIEGAEQRLRLHVRKPIAATWTGGDGNYTDAGSWSFSEPTAAAIPSNGGLEVFDVRIGGGPGADSIVILNDEASVNGLSVAAGDALDLATGSRLILAKPLGSSDAREIRNDGTIALDGMLTSENALAFSGTGTLQLPDDASLHIRPLGDETIDIIDVTNGVGHTIQGAGSIRTTTSSFASAPRGVFANAGTIDATGSNALFLDAHVENDGVITASGAGGLRISEPLIQRGLLRAAGGSRLELDAFSQETDAAVTELGPGAFLSVDTGVVNGGRVTLAGGTIEARRRVTDGITISSEGLLEGNGTVRMTDPSFSRLTVGAGGALAPGLSGIGRLEIDGGLVVSSGATLLMEIAGATPDLVDRIDVSRNSSVSGVLSVSLLDGFQPAQGDAFELIHASATSVPAAVDLPTLGDGLFLVPERQADADGVSVWLRTKREVAAAWSGPSGDYFAPSWGFSVAPISASAPSNDAQNIFDVEIGSSGPVDVTLDAAARVESLSLGSASSLALGAGASLTIQRTPDRAQSGWLVNDGSIRIGSSAATASLLSEGNLEIQGRGTIELGGSSSLGSGTVTNGADHTIRGAGRIGGSSVRNLGLVEATSATVMSLGNVENDGVVRAIGTGGVFISFGTNRGLIESGPGSSIRTGSIVNAGRLDVHAGSSYTGGILQTSDAAVTRIAGSLVAQRFTALTFEEGLLDLEGGSVTIGQPGLMIGAHARLEGDGAIRMGTATSSGVRIEGGLAPGRAGIGALEIASSFSLAATGLFSIELAGTEAGSQHDLVTVLGTSVLAGTLHVELLETGPAQALFAPSLGDVFDVLIAQTIDAAAVRYELPALDSGLGWDVGVVLDGGLARLRLHVVPEPGSATLLLFGLALLATSRSRRC